jgi:hypothetical protein
MLKTPEELDPMISGYNQRAVRVRGYQRVVRMPWALDPYVTRKAARNGERYVRQRFRHLEV